MKRNPQADTQKSSEMKR